MQLGRGPPSRHRERHRVCGQERPAGPRRRRVRRHRQRTRDAHRVSVDARQGAWPSAPATIADGDRPTATTASGLDIVAPSDDDDPRRQGITTTDVTLRGKGYSTGAYCDDFGGTSSATPLVAGVAALVLSANPSLRWDQVRDVLTGTAEKIDRANARYRDGYSLEYGFGRVNAEAAVAAARARKGRRRRTPQR